MLTVHVDIEGTCDAETRDRVHHALVQAVQDSAPGAGIRITGGESTDPSAIIRAYLDAMERRDAAEAQSYLAEGFTMQFPGTSLMTALDELTNWSRDRYQHVRKTYHGFEVVAARVRPVVFARGTLHGAWPDGRPFDGIRFIDRFELADGQILRQEVWNDLAEVKGKT